MSSDAFTIKIFVPNGDPEGVRIVELMNWTGKGIVFPRLEWTNTKQRDEFRQAGIYLLVGQTEEDDLPSIYIGQTDFLRDRLDNHEKNKDFWDRAMVFVSTNYSLNRGHITWLEYALVQQARQVAQCRLLNDTSPKEPSLSESEKADTQSFLRQVLQILPLVGLRALETRRAVAMPKTLIIEPSQQFNIELDTVVVPAQKDGFEKVFLGENCWHAIRISGGMLNRIKYIAAYQTQPISAITHYAPVESIEPYGENGKYKLIFSETAIEIAPIPFANAPAGAMQGPRYTSLLKLQSAKKLAEIF
jgi:hypothetical protein